MHIKETALYSTPPNWARSSSLSPWNLDLREIPRRFWEARRTFFNPDIPFTSCNGRIGGELLVRLLTSCLALTPIIGKTRWECGSVHLIVTSGVIRFIAVSWGVWLKSPSRLHCRWSNWYSWQLLDGFVHASSSEPCRITPHSWEIVLNFDLNARFLTYKRVLEIIICDPTVSSKNKITCWNVLRDDKSTFTVRNTATVHQYTYK